MHPLIAPKLDDLQSLCRRYGVAKLDLVGSAAAGSEAPHDLDFLVEFGPLPFGTRADAFFDLRDELMKLFDLPVDLLEGGAVQNAYLLASINQARVQLYAAA